jgi:hypothetical protein
MRGRSDIPDTVGSLPHRAAPLLDRIRRGGVPVVLKSEPWSLDKLDECYARGAHTSANDYGVFLEEEFEDFCAKGFWMLLPYDKVRELPGLQLAPIGVVPQRDRRPRVIVDYSYWGLNDATLKLSDPLSMQFGKAQERMLQARMKANPKFGTVKAYKVDIGDGFYRVPIATSGVIKLGVLLPEMPSFSERMVAFPLVLPMGWTESPPFFCKFTETACDLTNEAFRKNRRYPPHPLEDKAGKGDDGPNPDGTADHWKKRPIPKSHQRSLYSRPLAYMDVFVDDFCGQGQDHPQNPLVNQRRTLLHNIDKIFRPSDDRDIPERKEPISESKLGKEDAAFKTMKRCLGWDHATESRQLVMASHRKEKVLELLRELRYQNRASLQQWQSLIGQLRSLVVGLPGSEGQFSLLQAALRDGQQGRVRIDEATRAQLQHLIELVGEAEPSRIEELVPGDPIHLGACDAAKQGMGGVWFTDEEEPLVWREPFPPNVQADVVSFDNPKGTVTNSDLELAGTIVHQAVLGSQVAVEGETAHTLCDNTPAVAWRTKGSTTSTHRNALLLRLAAAQRRVQRANHRISHIAGVDNVMGDDASRLFHLDDEKFLTHFNRTYPQRRSWKLCKAPSGLNSQVIFLLSTKMSGRGSAPSELLKDDPFGTFGAPSAAVSTRARTSPSSTTPSTSSWSSPGDGEMDGSHPLGTRSALERRRMPYGKWARHSPQWGPTTRG